MGEIAEYPGNADLETRTSTPKDYSQLCTLVVVSTRNDDRVKVLRALESTSLPPPSHIALDKDDGAYQAGNFLYDIIISDIKNIADMAQRTPVLVESGHVPRGHLDTDKPSFREDLVSAIYGKRHKLLIVEYEEGEKYKQRFEKLGYDVVIAQDREKAMPLLGEGGIDLVLVGSSIDKAPTEGMNTTQEINVMYEGRMPIVLETDFYRDPIIQIATGAGAYAVVKRKDDLTELTQRVAEALKGKEPGSLVAKTQQKEAGQSATPSDEVEGCIEEAQDTPGEAIEATLVDVGEAKILYVGSTNQSRSIQQGLEERGYRVERKSYMIEAINGLLCPGERETYEGISLVLVTRDIGSYEGVQATDLLEVLAKCLPGVPVVYQTEQDGALVEPVRELAGRFNNYMVLVGKTDTSDIFWQIEQSLQQRAAEEAQLQTRGEVAKTAFEQLGAVAERRKTERTRGRTATFQLDHTS